MRDMAGSTFGLQEPRPSLQSRANACNCGEVCNPPDLAYVRVRSRGRPMQRERRVKLFRNGSDQTVRIPAEFELPGDEALIYRRGDRLVIEPVRKQSLLAVLAGLTPLDEDFPSIDEEQPPLRDVAL